MGGGNNTGHPRRAAGGTAFLLNSDAWVGERRARAARRVRRRAPAGRRRRAAALATRTGRSSARSAATRRSGGSRPSTCSCASSAPETDALNAFYGGGFAHDVPREVESLQGAALLVRREAIDEVGLFDESFFMFSEETDWLSRFRRGRLGGVVHADGRGRPPRRRLARRPALRREPARDPALPRQAHGARARPSAPGCSCSGRCALRSLALPRRARAGLPRRRALPRLGRRPGAALDDLRVPAARLRDRGRAASRAPRRAGARAARRSRRRSPGRSARCSWPGRPCSSSTARSRSPPRSWRRSGSSRRSSARRRRARPPSRPGRGRRRSAPRLVRALAVFVGGVGARARALAGRGRR